MARSDGRMSRGEQYMQQQMAEMEASGLGGQAAVDPAQAHLDWVRTGRGPQWREWWRVVVGAALLIGGAGLWFAAHRSTVPPPVVGRYGSITGVDANIRASGARLLREIVGVFIAIGGLVWLLNQVWPRRRTYAPRDVRRAWLTAALLAAGVVLWLLASSPAGLGTHAFAALIVATMQISYITRTTGPDTVRRPANDPRGDMYRFLTPWPVVLGVSVVFCGYQIVHLLR